MLARCSARLAGAAPRRPAASGTPLARGGAGDPQPYDVHRGGAVEASSCTGRSRCAPLRQRVPQRRPGPPGLARARWRRTPRDKGQVYARASGLRLQRRRPADRAAGREADVIEERARSASPSATRRRRCSAWSTTSLVRPRLRRRARDLGTPSSGRWRDVARRLRHQPAHTASPTRSAAAALARALRRGPAGRGRGDGLRAFRPGRRTGSPTSRDGRTASPWVDDSKATNPHAAGRARCHAFDAVVWVAGGLAKGATFDDLVAGARSPAARAPS